MSLLPFKTKTKGPAPKLDSDEAKEHKDLDIIDETIRFFRINVLFKSFELKCNDLFVVYLILCIQLKKQM